MGDSAYIERQDRAQARQEAILERRRREQAQQEAVGKADTADCYTMRRMTALRPGEKFRYLTCPENAFQGPACKALIARIHDHARGLSLAGRVILTKEIRIDGEGKKAVRITDFFATGKERRQ